MSVLGKKCFSIFRLLVGCNASGGGRFAKDKSFTNII